MWALCLIKRDKTVSGLIPLCVFTMGKICKGLHRFPVIRMNIKTKL